VFGKVALQDLTAAEPHQPDVNFSGTDSPRYHGDTITGIQGLVRLRSLLAGK
jgi:hypothetical protein